MIAPARAAALRCLVAIADADTDLASALEAARLRLGDARDRALLTDIVTGVQRWRATLDHLIAACARRPLERLDPEVLEILRLSVYQLLHLTRVPASAVVDDAVNLTGRAGKASARGFVNAVLRSVSRTRNALPLPPRPTDPADRDAALDYLATTLSHPRWLAARWLDRVGFEAAERWMRYNNQPPPLVIRANTLRTTVEALQRELAAAGIDARRGRYAPDALRIEREAGARVEDLDRWQSAFLVQDEASQLVALLAGPAPGRRVLDGCASPGGKTTALAAAQVQAHARGALAGPAPMLVACDVRSRRIETLRRTLARAGASRVYVVQADLRRPLPFRQTFDCVLVDAPCSGLGTVRRDPDIKWRRQPDDLPALASTQQTMLAQAACAVSPGGRLIYATCSSEPEENEQVARHFERTVAGFVREDARAVHPALDRTLVDADGALRTTPFEHELDAFFGAIYRRAPDGSAPPR